MPRHLPETGDPDTTTRRRHVERGARRKPGKPTTKYLEGGPEWIREGRGTRHQSRVNVALESRKTDTCR